MVGQKEANTWQRKRDVSGWAKPSITSVIKLDIADDQ